MVTDIQVHALVELITQSTHRLFCHLAKVEGVGSRLTPVEKSRAQRIAPVIGTANDSQRSQFIEEPMGRRLRHVQLRADMAQSDGFTGTTETIDQIAGFLEN
jgi:hypothetical protein